MRLGFVARARLEAAGPAGQLENVDAKWKPHNPIVIVAISSLDMEEAANARTVSFHALRRARRTIQDFWLSYHPYHGLHLKDFFRWWDVLVWVEATIYGVDEDNERLARDGAVVDDLTFKEYGYISTLLQSRGLLTDAVATELQQGATYWQQERLLCSQMLEHASIPLHGHDPGFTLAALHATSCSKSFDYRVLNLLLYALRGQQPDAVLLEFLRVDEHLVDIGDDLVDYEDDVEQNSFNIYRGYVHLFGVDAQLKLVERISEYEQRHSELLAQLDPGLQQAHLARRQDAAEQPDALRWVFPTPILEEVAFREARSSGDERSDSG